jgi:hypothetical protein
MRNPFIHRRVSTSPARRLDVHRLEDRLAPATFTVNSLLDTASPPAGVTTLRSAILAADADNNTDPAHPDVINFSLSGTIPLTSALTALTGSVSIQGPGATSLSVLGPANGTNQRLLTINPGAAASISGLTMDGNGFHNSGIAVGAGSSLALQDATVQNTYTTGNGGGLAVTGGAVTVTRGRFVADYTDHLGGAIAFTGGTLAVSQSTFDSDFGGQAGGGIYDSAAGGLTVVGSTFSNNITGSQGGGIMVISGPAAVADCTFAGNNAGVGGGIAVFQGTAPASLTLVGSTLAGNTVGPSADGGGLFVQAGTTATVRDTIIAGNSGGNVLGAVDPASGFNLIGDGTGLTGPMAGVNGNQIGTTAAPINPRLGPLQNNGGPALTMALLPGSPAIDGGAPAPALDGLTTTDECGGARVVAQSFVVPPAGGDGRDIGAYELPHQTTPTVLTVNTLTDATATPPPAVLTLRQAVQAADGLVPLSSLPVAQINAGSPYFDQVQFSVIGTINLTSALPPVGPGAAVGLQGPGASALTVLGPANGNYQPVLTVNPGAAAVIAGLTVDGNGLHNSGIAVGANGSLVVRDATIQNTYTSGNGGGLAITGGAVSVTRGRFANDYTDHAGGAIALSGGTLTVSQSTFDSDFGGQNGGGIYDAAGVLTVTASTFSNNFTGNHGAGIIVFGASATVADSTFVGNNAGVGGGIAVLQGTAPASLTLVESTLAANTAGPGAAGGGLFVQAGATATVTNTIVAGNSGGDVYGALGSTSGYDLIGDGTNLTGLTNGTGGNQIGSAAAPINPLLGPLADNGGPTKTMALLAGSPALDHGGTDTVLAGLGVSTDERGQPRVTSLGFVVTPAGGDGRDVGAVEVQPTTLTVNTTSDSATSPAGTLTLRQAIQVADGSVPLSSVPAGQVVAGDAGFYQVTFGLTAASTIALAGQLPAITGAVSIRGPGASTLTILGAGNGTNQPVLAVNAPATAELSGLTLDGNALHNSGIAVGANGSLILQDATVQNTYTAGNGGGLAITGGAVSVTRGRFIGDYAEQVGGAIAVTGGALTVSQSTFDSDFAGLDGGGIYAAGAGGLTVVGSTFSNNIAENRGGGIESVGIQTTVSDSTFAGNTANAGGGIAELLTPAPNSLTLTSSTLAGNNTGVGSNGGGLFVQIGAPATIRSTIIAGNTGGDVFGSVAAAGDHNLIGDGTGMSGLANGVNGNQVGTTAAPISPLLGPLADNGGPTKTMALLPGSPSINTGSNPANLAVDQRGYSRVVGPAADIGAFEVQIPSTIFGVLLPPTVQSVVINGGAAQRSMVTSIAVTFSAQVAFTTTPAAAFSLTRVGDAATVSFTATAAVVGGETVVTLSGFTGPAAQNGSLADGRYTLHVIAGQVTANGFILDGNDDGTAGDDYFSPADTAGGGPGQLHLYRLFGDATGDGIVDLSDLAAFRSTYNTAAGAVNYLAYLDANGDGAIDLTDLTAFRARFNQTVF